MTEEFAERQHSDEKQLPIIVGLGASAGGLEALRSFLRAVEPDMGAAYVVIQHLDPDRQSMLAQILNRSTPMPVLEAENGAVIEPNSVYVIPPNQFLKLVDGRLFLDEFISRPGSRMPIDYFFRSLAETSQESAIAVVLSGAGSDGTLGIREINANGGLVLSQDLDEAMHDGMPRSAMATGLVDISAPVATLPKHVKEYIQRLTNGWDAGLEMLEKDGMRAIVSVLKAQTDHDFRSYKKGPLARRVRRRMGVRRVRSIPEYVDVLRRDRDEVQLLFRDLLINMTRFFRDREAWAELDATVISSLVEKAEVGSPIRVWVPGCASGEEAYTIAMLLDEACTRNGRGVDFRIFGTDLDAEAIAVARAGAYTENIAEDVTPERLERYFQREGDHYQISKRIRERVVFARQNLLSDPPFSRLQLITCRNLLIFLEAGVHRQVLQLFHFALAESGYLMLGTSELLGDAGDLFRTISPISRIYRKFGKSSLTRSHFPISAPKGAKAALTKSRRTRAVIEEESMTNAARRILLSRHAPAAFVIKRTGEVRYMQGPVRNYIAFPEGELPFSIYDLAFAGLRARIRSAIFGAIESEGRFSVIAPNVQRGTSSVAVRLDAELIRSSHDDVPSVLLTLSDLDPTVRNEKEKVGELAVHLVSQDQEDNNNAVVERLERVLQSTREELQSTIEELETFNEELKASNEEVMSMNEELQSTNEKLATVNNELHEKVRELEGVNNDLDNLLTSTDIAVLFLSPDRKIRRFTLAASSLLNIIPSDIGRPLSDLASRVEDPDLASDVDQVLKTLIPREREVMTIEKAWYIRRILPYRTNDNRIDGVVVTFNEVTTLKDVTKRLEARERQQAVSAALGQKALAQEPADKVFRYAAKEIASALDCEFSKVLKLNAEEKRLTLVAGHGWGEGDVGASLDLGANSQAGFALHSRAPVIVQNLDTETRFSTPEFLSCHGVKAGITIAIGPPERPWGVLGAHSKMPRAFAWEDMNFLQSTANILYHMVERGRAEGALAERTEYLQLALDAAAMGVWVWEPATDVAQCDDRICALFGLKRSEFPANGKAFFDTISDDDRERVRAAAMRVREQGGVFNEEFRVTMPGGETRWLAGAGKRLHPDGTSKLVGVNFDITERKRAAERQGVIMRELDHRVKNVLATIVSISSLSRSGAVSVDAYADAFQQRAIALARTHAALADAQWTGYPLRDLLCDELQPYIRPSEGNIDAQGPDIIVKPSAAQCLTLVIHELATNAAKYGALSMPTGKLKIRWSISKMGHYLDFLWAETDGPAVRKPEHEGFGIRMISELLTHQLDAKVISQFRREGYRCSIELPLDQIVRAGGQLADRKSTAIPDLNEVGLRIIEGRRILLVDDEWIVAAQHAAALRERGALIIGPLGSIPNALKAARTEELDCAVLDFNLDGEPITAAADILIERGVPIVLVTGYGSSITLPPSLDGVSRLDKPTSSDALVRAVAWCLLSRGDAKK